MSKGDDVRVNSYYFTSVACRRLVEQVGGEVNIRHSHEKSGLFHLLGFNQTRKGRRRIYSFKRLRLLHVHRLTNIESATDDKSISNVEYVLNFSAENLGNETKLSGF